MFKRFTVVVAALALGAGFAFAEEGHDHAGHDHGAAHDHHAKHGGVVMHSGHHVLELVAKGGTIELYVAGEEGATEALDGAKATATVLADGKTETVALVPAGNDVLKGTGNFNAGKGTTVVVSLIMPGHEPEQTRFKID